MAIKFRQETVHGQAGRPFPYTLCNPIKISCPLVKALKTGTHPPQPAQQRSIAVLINVF